MTAQVSTINQGSAAAQAADMLDIMIDEGVTERQRFLEGAFQRLTTKEDCFAAASKGISGMRELYSKISDTLNCFSQLVEEEHGVHISEACISAAFYDHCLSLARP